MLNGVHHTLQSAGHNSRIACHVHCAYTTYHSLASAGAHLASQLQALVPAASPTAPSSCQATAEAAQHQLSSARSAPTHQATSPQTSSRPAHLALKAAPHLKLAPNLHRNADGVLQGMAAQPILRLVHNARPEHTTQRPVAC
jgi:hypothetical protein